MALPAYRQKDIERHPSVDAARDRAAARHQEDTLAFYLRRRLYQTTPVAPATTLSSIVDRVVLQKDFANVVSSPTGGWVECQIVIDGDRIRIYSQP